MNTITNTREKIISSTLSALTIRSIIASINVYLLSVYCDHYLPYQEWEKINNQYFLNIAEGPLRNAAIAAQLELNILKRERIIQPDPPAPNAVAAVYRDYDIANKIFERESNIVADIIKEMRNCMTNDSRLIMDSQHINTIEEIMNFWYIRFGTVSNEQQLAMWSQINEEFKIPTNEDEKNKVIDEVDSRITNFISICLPNANQQTTSFLQLVYLKSSAEATAISNEHMENALSLLPQTYTAEDLATIVKNVLRNVKTNGNGNHKAKTAKQAAPDMRPNAPCHIHSEGKPHTNAQCFQQIKAKKAKAIPPKKAKATNAKATKDASDSEED